MPTTTSQRRVVAIDSAEYNKQPQPYLTAPDVAHELSTGARKRFFRLPQVKGSTGLSRTSTYRKIASHVQCAWVPNLLRGLTARSDEEGELGFADGGAGPVWISMSCMG